MQLAADDVTKSRTTFHANRHAEYIKYCKVGTSMKYSVFCF